MKFVVVPNYVSDEINRKLDEMLKDKPHTEKDREILYDQFLSIFDERGSLEGVTLKRTDDRRGEG